MEVVTCKGQGEGVTKALQHKRRYLRHAGTVQVVDQNWAQWSPLMSPWRAVPWGPVGWRTWWLWKGGVGSSHMPHVPMVRAPCWLLPLTIGGTTWAVFLGGGAGVSVPLLTLAFCPRCSAPHPTWEIVTQGQGVPDHQALDIGGGLQVPALCPWCCWWSVAHGQAVPHGSVLGRRISREPAA